MKRISKEPKPSIQTTAVGRLKKPLWDAPLGTATKDIQSVREYRLLSEALGRSRAMAFPIKRAILRAAESSHEATARAGTKVVSNTAVLVNAILASDFSYSVETWLMHVVESSPTVYDKAADAIYNASHIGGGQLHRLFDGSHALWGMWEKTHNALPNDSVLQETVGYFKMLWQDLSTHVGLPIVTWDRANYDQVASFLSSNFHIPRLWLQDLLHVNTVELLSTTLGAFAIIYCWNNKDVQRFSTLCGSLGVASVVSANPLLAIFVMVSIAKAFSDAKHQNNYEQLVHGLAKGGVGTAVLLGTAALVPGPALVGVIAGICAGLAVHKASNKVNLSEVAEFISTSVKAFLPSPRVEEGTA